MSFTFRTRSTVHLIILLLILLFLIAVLLSVVDLDEVMYGILYVIMASLSWFIADRISTGIVTIELKEDKLILTWIKKPPLSFSKNQQIKVSDIIGWRFQPDSKVHRFKIFLKDKLLRIERNSSWEEKDDDFDRFLRQFQRVVAKENQKRQREKLDQIIDAEVYLRNSEFRTIFYIFLIFSLLVGAIAGISNAWSSAVPLLLFSLSIAFLYAWKYKRSKHLDKNPKQIS